MTDLTSQDYVKLAKENMEELDRIKSVLHSQLSDIKVRIDKVKNADIYDAITAIFGERAPNDPNRDYITFDMFVYCVQIIKLAGRSKGQEILNKKGI